VVITRARVRVRVRTWVKVRVLYDPQPAVDALNAHLAGGWGPSGAAQPNWRLQELQPAADALGACLAGGRAGEQCACRRRLSGVAQGHKPTGSKAAVQLAPPRVPFLL